jgi:hypothetical protein
MPEDLFRFLENTQNELLKDFNQRVLVYSAVDTDEVYIILGNY